jgi:hypothetical protein
MLRQPPATMRVLGTQLPTTQTVHERAFGPMPRGRPLVVPPKNLKLQKDKSRPQNYRLLWQKMKPLSLQSGEDRLKPFLPNALMPQAMRVVQARTNRLVR